MYSVNEIQKEKTMVTRKMEMKKSKMMVMTSRRRKRRRIVKTIEMKITEK